MSTQDLGRRFQMRQHMVALGDDYTISNDKGVKICEVDGKAMRLRNTLVINDAQGNERYQVQEKLVRVRKTYQITRGSATVATIQKALINPARDRFSIDMDGGADMTATGSVLDHEYTLKRGFTTVAQVSKSWFSVRDTYGIDIKGDDDPFLIIAIAVALDALAHPAN